MPERVLWGIIFCSLVATLAYAFIYRIQPLVDAQAYDAIALNLLSGCGFKEVCEQSFVFDTAIIRAGPGYEFFLAGVYALFGHSYAAVWVVQAILHAATAGLVFLIGRRLFSEGGIVIGLVAAASIGFHPDLIEASAMLLTETLYLFLTTLTIWFFVRAYELPGSWRWAGGLGFVAGLAILSRPPVFLFVPIILVAYALRKNFFSAAVFICVLGAVLAPWTLRNYHHFKTFIPTTLVGGYNIWIGNTLQSNGGQISGGFNPVTTYSEANGFLNFKQKANQEFKSFLLEHPLSFIKLSLIRTIRYFSLIRPMGFWFYQQGLSQAIFVALSGVAIAFLFMFGFIGLPVLWRVGTRQHRYLAVMAFSSIIVLLPTVVQSRYRFQIYPLLAIFAAYIVVNRKKIWSEQRRIVLVVSGFLTVVSIIDVFAFWSVIVSHLKVLGL